MAILNLRRDDVVRINGPARVEVKKGKVLVVGAIYSEGSAFVVHALRSYGIKALEDSELKLVLGSGASVEGPSEGEEVVDSWLKICTTLEDDLKTLSRALILIVGPIESGKTTLSAFITNYFLQKGVKVAIIDADIGQEDLDIPATIALAEPKEIFIWQRELMPSKLKFVGCISPQYCQSTILSALKELISEIINNYKVIVVNTDGWITSQQAFEFKLNIIRWIKPTHVIVLDRELGMYLTNSLPNNIKVIEAPKPLKVRERGRDERRRLRAEAYKKYFTSAKEVHIQLGNIKIIGSCIFNGKELSMDELSNYIKIPEELKKDIVYASKYFNNINIVLSSNSVHIPRLEVRSGIEINIIKPKDYEGILVGILDERMNDVAVGIIRGIDFKNKTINIVTPWDGKISAIIIGKVKLLLDTFEDTGRISRCII